MRALIREEGVKTSMLRRSEAHILELNFIVKEMNTQKCV